ncbi:MAG: 50S ribosomal protein L7/L12 [Gemmatimonadetes bacterium]|nr:50S ribosomal protein L7/L12 [Gemmatimonadota bacterium]
MSDIAGGFLSAWLAASFDVTQPRYIVECYGPRDHPLEGYWPRINVLQRKRVAPRAATGAAPGDAVSGEPAPAGDAESDSGDPGAAECDVVLTSAGDRRLEVIKLVRELTGAGLKEAKDIVFGAPALLKTAVTKAEAERLEREFRAVGATIESLPAGDSPASLVYEVGPAAAPRRDTAAVPASDGAIQPAPAPPTPAPPRKNWWQRLFARDDTSRETGRPDPGAPPVSPLSFTVRSLKVQQSHDYGAESARKTMTASAAYRILVADVVISNPTPQPQRFSSQQLAVLDVKGAVVGASFDGVGDTIAQSGHVISTESTTREGDGSPVVSYKGKLSADVSYLEWELHPHKTYEDELVFVIPAAARAVTVRLSG